EREAVRTTIVGGRPPGSGKSNGSIPRGIEVLVKKASVDAAFRDALLTKRAETAAQIGLELDDAETAMLAAIPESQLIGIIHNTKVSPKARPVFMEYTAAAMLAALGVTAGVATDASAVEPLPKDTELGEYYEEIDVRMAIQPDDDYLDDKLLDTGTIQGFIETVNGIVVPDANIIVLGTDFVATAGEDGHFEIDGLPPGTYTVEARDDEGAWINTATVTIFGGGITEVIFNTNVKEMTTGSRPDMP
ncbi:MAG: carboxypeptidase regulatory-like domain-containing protein, partial [bacterium]|nr:carboxypeptidase regulatory-like domain-containing protein [bacterium]